MAEKPVNKAKKGGKASASVATPWTGGSFESTPGAPDPAAQFTKGSPSQGRSAYPKL